MYKTKVEVPAGIEHVSDWIGYTIPTGKLILDKDVTGCGYTEFCLRNDQNVVLCSPRKMLLKNKAEQHQNDPNVLYVKNEMKDYEGAKSFEDEVRDQVFNCVMAKVPCKLMVTYDSTFRIVNVLKEMGVLNQFFFVVDEFQSIFLDSYFKSDVELDFVENLQDCSNILYLSATPMLDKYLEQLDYFKDLPFVKLDWSKTNVVEKLFLKRKFATSLTSECSKIIQSYLNGKYEFTLTKDNQIVYSTEAVFYFNSVKDIAKVIKKNNLKPDQVNILCAETTENITRLQKLTRDVFGAYYRGDKFTIGEVPLEKDRDNNKMFTFCTKSAYIGSDFHSKSARSFVFADPNITSLALDISLDLPQIAGRQRDKDNPFKNDITIFYRTIRKGEMVDRARFDKLQKDRQATTMAALSGYEKLNEAERAPYVRGIRASIKLYQYQADFISISKHTNQLVYNKLIELANERAWEVSQKDYQDSINVTKSLEAISDSLSDYLDENEKIAQEFLDNHFYKTGIFTEKMKMYCEFMDRYKDNMEIEDILSHKIQDNKFKTYYNFFGTSGCRAASYIDSNLSRLISNASKEDMLRVSIMNQFTIGNSYTKKSIKTTLATIYQDLGIVDIKAKASDLEKYFNLTRAQIPNSNGKRSEGFRIDSKKGEV